MAPTTWQPLTFADPWMTNHLLAHEGDETPRVGVRATPAMVISRAYPTRSHPVAGKSRGYYRSDIATKSRASEPM